MVAAALDEAHKDVRSHLPTYERSVPLGWRFMDKFVQLPFTIPPSDGLGVTNFIAALLPEAPPATENGATGGLLDESPAKSLASERRRRVFSRLISLLPARVRNAWLDVRGPDMTTAGALGDHRLVEEIIARQAEVQRALSERLTDDSGAVRDLVARVAPGFSSNPREIKRLINLARFYLMLRVGRIAVGKPVPEIAQYERWILLTLRWPDMARWLQWGATAFVFENDDAALRGSVAARLRRLERHAEGSADFTAWSMTLTKRLGLLADGGETIPWLNDEVLFTFFKCEVSKPPDQRISAGAEVGYF